MTTEYIIDRSALSNPGRKRAQNEDFVAFFEPDNPAQLQASGRLYIVADGVGGAARGEKASQYAVRKVLYDYYRDADPDVGERLRHALRLAGNAIYEHVERSGHLTKMATTMVAAVVRGTTLTVANVGDSRAYLLRNGSILQITRDHTIAGEMIQSGELSEAEAMNMPGKNRITRSLGGEKDVHVDIFADVKLLPGDRILLCSDGLARYTLSEDILSLASSGSPREVVERCISYANQKGGVDNISVVLIEIGQLVLPSDATIRHEPIPTPQPVDWDSMETDPFFQASRPPLLRERLPTRLVLLGGLGLILVLATVLAGFALTGRGGDDETTQVDTTEPAPVGELPTTPAPTEEPAAHSECSIQVADGALPMYEGPNLSSQVTTLYPGQTHAVLCRPNDEPQSGWVQVRLPPVAGDNGPIIGWVFTQLQGDCRHLAFCPGEVDQSAETLEGPLTVTEESLPELDPTVEEAGGRCHYTIQDADSGYGISHFASKFDLREDSWWEFRHTFSDPQGSWHDSDLAPDDNGDPSVLGPGSILLVPVYSQEECELGGGEWVNVP